MSAQDSGQTSGCVRRIGLLTTDTDLVIKSWDEALALMTRVPADQALGRRLSELVPDLDRRVRPEMLREPLVTGAPQILAAALHKYLIPCPPLDPSTEFEHMQQRVVIGALRAEDRVVGLVITIEDVTARVERERQLARELAAPLAHDDWQVRRSAVHAMAARTDAEIIAALVNALREGHRNFSLLSSALQLLTVAGIDSTAAFVGLLQHEDADLRVQAALALGTQRGPEAAEALMDALDDSDTNVRFHAIESLGKLGASAAIDRLAAIAESEDFFLAFPAIQALVRLNDPLIVSRLTPLLNNPVMGIAAVEALATVGDEEAVVPLCVAVGDQILPVEPLVEALAGIHQRFQQIFGPTPDIEDLVRRHVTPKGVSRVLAALERVSGETLKHCVLVLGWLDDSQIPSALAALLGSADAHREVIEALVRSGAPAVELLLEELDRGTVSSRSAAIVALGRLGHRRAVPALVQILRTEDDRALWPATAAALARIGDDRAFDVLMDRLGDPDPALRQTALSALNSIGHSSMESRVKPLIDDANPRIRESAVKIAGYFGYGGCFEGLMRHLRDEEEIVRVAVLEHLPYFEDPRVVAVLASAAANETPRVRAAAARALGVVPGEIARGILNRTMTDPEPWVRYFAAASLGRQGHPDAIPALAVAASGDPAPQVRLAAVEGLGQIGGAAAAEVLEPLTAAPDGELATAAVRMLGRLRSAAAVPRLIAVTRSSDPARRMAAVEALGACGDLRAIDVLQWMVAADADDAVARASLAGLAALSNEGTPIAEAAVRAMMTCANDRARRADVISALTQLGAAAVPWLAAGLDDDDPFVRRAVTEALGRMPHAVASACLQRALTDHDAVVRRSAIAALSRRGARGLIPRFAALARTDPSVAVRQTAMAALRRHGNDPDASAHA